MFFFLPYGNDRKTTHFPAITYFLIAVNVGIYLWLLPLDPNIVVQKVGLIPGDPSIGNMISSMFVHGSVLHLAWNMLFLWLFGPSVEDALGHAEFGLFYLASGLAAALLHIVVVLNFIPSAVSLPVVGASGAIAGILGIFAIRFYRTGIRIFWYVGILFYPLRWGTFTISATVGLSIWLLHQLLGGLASIINPLSEGGLKILLHGLQRIGLGEGVAYWSHIGGMAFGMLLARVLKMDVDGKKEYLMRDAKSSMEQGTTMDAAEQLHMLLEHDPQNADVYASLGKTYALGRDAELSIANYHRGVDMCLERGDCDKAVAIFAELKHFYRNARLDIQSEYKLARYLGESGCHEPAIRLMLEIAASYPGRPEAEVSLLKAADAYLNALGNLQEAIRCYERFIEEYPQSPWRAKVESSLSDVRKSLP